MNRDREEKSEGKKVTTKVQRYRAGRVPDYALKKEESRKPVDAVVVKNAKKEKEIRDKLEKEKEKILQKYVKQEVEEVEEDEDDRLYFFYLF